MDRAPPEQESRLVDAHAFRQHGAILVAHVPPNAALERRTRNAGQAHVCPIPGSPLAALDPSWADGCQWSWCRRVNGGAGAAPCRRILFANAGRVRPAAAKGRRRRPALNLAGAGGCPETRPHTPNSRRCGPRPSQCAPPTAARAGSVEAGHTSASRPGQHASARVERCDDKGGVRPTTALQEIGAYLCVGTGQGTRSCEGKGKERGCGGGICGKKVKSGRSDGKGRSEAAT